MGSTKRIVYILVILLISSVSYAQDDVLDEIVDVSYEGISMEALLDSMYLRYAFNFSYDPSALPVDSVLNVNYSQHSLCSILQEVFKNYDLSFKSVGRQVIISHQKREVALSNYITLRGRVVSADNGQSIPLVNIAVMGESLGTSTNMDGEFVFLIPQHLAGAALHMSSIGYSSYSMAVPQRDTTVLVLLRSQSIQLKEIKVRFIRPREIIKRMVENRARNYFTSPMLLTAFFRESIRQDGKYIEVSEAVLDIYKSSYLKTSDREEARLVKGRKKVEDEDVFLARLKLAGGPALFSTIDVAKHLNFISEEEDDNYFYIHKGKDIVRDRVVYRVGFKPIVELDDIYYEGELCVDVETFALISADFSMTRKTLRKSDQYLIRKNAKRIKSVPVFTRYQVDYRPYGGKWILNSVRGELIIKMQDKRNKTRSEYQASADLLITNAQQGKDQRIRYSEAYKINYVLADQIVGYDPMFWKDYNVIHPEEELIKIFKSTPVEINLVPQPKKTKP